MIGKVRFLAAAMTLSGVPVAKAFDVSSVCKTAVQAAEQQAGIPPRLLDAISRVESGRRDPNGSATVAWPWTVNAAGKGYFYESKDEAIAAVRDFQAHGIVSIDVGCMQINLHHHPDAFFRLKMLSIRSVMPATVPVFCLDCISSFKAGPRRRQPITPSPRPLVRITLDMFWPSGTDSPTATDRLIFCRRLL